MLFFLLWLVQFFVSCLRFLFIPPIYKTTILRSFLKNNIVHQLLNCPPCFSHWSGPYFLFIVVRVTFLNLNYNVVTCLSLTNFNLLSAIWCHFCKLCDMVYKAFHHVFLSQKTCLPLPPSCTLTPLFSALASPNHLCFPPSTALSFTSGLWQFLGLGCLFPTHSPSSPKLLPVSQSSFQCHFPRGSLSWSVRIGAPPTWSHIL